MKHTIYILFLLFIATSVHAQLNQGFAIVKTHDGSIYQGTVIEDEMFQIKMILPTLDTITVPKSSIKKIRNAKNITLVNRDKFHKKGGIFFKFQNSFGLNSEENQTNQISLIAGKRFTEQFHAGGGIGFNVNRVVLPGNFWSEHKFVNLFAFAKYNLNQKKWRPFFDLSAGVGISTNHNNFWEPHTSGIYIQPGFGFDIANRKNVKWTLKLSQYIQKTSGSFMFQDNLGSLGHYDYKHLYNRTMLTIGINF